MKKHLIFLLCAIMALTSSAAGNPNDGAGNHEITIMTYNIKMLPRGATFLHHHPVIRARLIPTKLLAESPDVIVFEEAFDGAAIRAIKKRLKATYPYMAGQHNRRVVTYKRAGGVLIFSKYPLKELESIAYSQCKGADCLGHKGSILVEVEHPVQKFQLLGTHIQAGGNRDLKTSQYQEAAALVERHTQPGIPQFIAGDFNTHKDDTTLYNILVSTLKADDGTVDNEAQALQGHAQNDMRDKPNPKKKKGIIDYVFVKANGAHILSQQRYTRQFQQQWSAKHKDLSDHFAVILKVKI
jgi:endonuclease/exonuclease/phosphatase family metal-dependent hydrolase